MSNLRFLLEEVGVAFALAGGVEGGVLAGLVGELAAAPFLSLELKRDHRTWAAPFVGRPSLDHREVSYFPFKNCLMSEPRSIVGTVQE